MLVRFFAILILLSPSWTFAQSTDVAAHWIAPTQILLSPQPNAAKFYLLHSAKGGIKADNINGWIESAIALPKAQSTPTHSYPHLAGFTALSVDIAKEKIKRLQKGQLLVGQFDKQDKLIGLSQIQNAKLLDALYTSGPQDADEAKLGSWFDGTTAKFALWAPTAQQVLLRLYNEQDEMLGVEIPMQEDSKTGVWSYQMPNGMPGLRYQYQVNHYSAKHNFIDWKLVTDPYSVDLTTNSRLSRLEDLSHPETKSSGWDEHTSPSLDRPEQQIIYEMHIGDFSNTDQSLVDDSNAGKYGAFLEKESDGIKHLKALRAAGLNTLHLLPTFDIATINEDPNKSIRLTDSLSKVCQLVVLAICNKKHPQLTLKHYLRGLDPDGEEAQAVVEALRGQDNYNWGYDPFHFNVPEGSYAKNPDGRSRVIEFRQMIQAIHNMGFRVVMDVVYNHTHAAGDAATAVLDKVVPGYYQRRHPITGAIEQSTCCDNTATEHRMMAKLMIDSLVLWAKEYKIDGFRFDLMGHQPKDLMVAAREAVRAVDPDTYFYGEGWNFGEVANNSQFVQASQAEMAGTEIGTFTDRLRDAIRGGASFASGKAIRTAQGLGNGLFTMPNELQPTDKQKDHFLLLADQARIGLAGNLADFPLINAQGEKVTGKDIPYGSGPTGYARDPADTINYVSKHDNQTLWDNNQYRIPFDTSAEDRVRMQVLSLAFAIYAQGIPFIHMGSELLRSKSFLRDSYDYGDWFNDVDFAKQSNNYHVGLPPAVKDKANWPLITTLLEQNQGRDKVTAAHIQAASARFMDMLSIRSNSPLFSLATAAQIQSSIHFLNTGDVQQLGLIVMSISALNSRSEAKEDLIVIFNLTGQEQQFASPLANDFVLHPTLVKGADKLLRQAKTQNGLFVVPKLSAAVFLHR